MEPGVVFCCYSLSTSRFDVLCILRCFFAHRVFTWVTIDFQTAQTSLAILLWDLTSAGCFSLQTFCSAFSEIIQQFHLDPRPIHSHTFSSLWCLSINLSSCPVSAWFLFYIPSFNPFIIKIINFLSFQISKAYSIVFLLKGCNVFR